MWNEIPDHIPDSRIHDQTTPTDDPPPESHGDVPQAKAQEVEPDYRSKTERRFAGVLDACEAVKVWRFEPCSYRIGPKRHYRPDFEVLREDGCKEYIEVKGGYIRPRSLGKPSAAAVLYPEYDWAVVVQSSKGASWELKWLMPNRPDRPETVAEKVTV